MPRKPTGRPNGRPPRYRWDAIFDNVVGSGSTGCGIGPGLYGFDEDCPLGNIQRMVLREARNRGLLVRTKVKPRAKLVLVTKVGKVMYPWDRWFDGEVHALIEGQAFRHTVDQFIELLLAEAKKRGLTVRHARVYNTVHVQASPPAPTSYA